ncbi:sialoadhesin-like [Centropristis striata]|uniref:sialoadhesin-like n=1 Tax=Centropristis striata TaxID=184440 RepID=UPI0027DFD8B4|nr:sialoadhesin-like [Centropristis striata]
MLMTGLCCSQNAVYPRVVPNTQQLFEYETVVFNCEGPVTGWRVMKQIKAGETICAANWDTSTEPCTIKPAFTSDSGTYWCEAGEKRSSSINITVTAGSVILVSPALPVIEGESVTLSCRQKGSSNLTAEFYKDGFLIKRNSTGNMILQTVSKSDEGLYKCSISTTEESEESWLAVRAFHKDSPSTDVCCSHGTSLRISLIILLLALGSLVVLYYWRKR